MGKQAVDCGLLIDYNGGLHHSPYLILPVAWMSARAGTSTETTARAQCVTPADHEVSKTS